MFSITSTEYFEFVRSRFSLIVIVFCFFQFSISAFADDVPLWNSITLTGDWGGKRSSWSDSGLNLEFTHRSDIISNVSGGLKQGGAWLGYTDVRALADLGKLYGWNGLTAYAQLHWVVGDKPNSNQVASYMGVDNIEVADNSAQLYHAWLQKNLLENRLSVLMGLYPIDSEFYVTETSGLFIHPSLGMAAEISQSGVSGPPIYPYGSFGTRLKYTSPNRTAYLQVAMLNGVPSDPSTQIRYNKSDGAFAIMEIGYTPLEAGQLFEPVLPEGASKMEPSVKLHEKFEGVNKTAVGVWRYSSRFDDLVDVDTQGNPIQRASIGWYMLAERTLYSEQEDAAKGLSGFLRYGTASADIHQSDWSASFGLRYIGLVSGRDSDTTGLAITTSHASSKYRNLYQSAESESMIEVTYRIQIQPWLAVQPLLQNIIHPNMDRSMPDVILLGARLEVFL